MGIRFALKFKFKSKTVSQHELVCGIESMAFSLFNEGRPVASSTVTWITSYSINMWIGNVWNHFKLVWSKLHFVTFQALPIRITIWILRTRCTTSHLFFFLIQRLFLFTCWPINGDLMSRGNADRTRTDIGIKNNYQCMWKSNDSIEHILIYWCWMRYEWTYLEMIDFSLLLSCDSAMCFYSASAAYSLIGRASKSQEKQIVKGAHRAMSTCRHGVDQWTGSSLRKFP